MKRKHWSLGVVALIFAVATMDKSVSAGTISSNNFSLGYGYTNAVDQWNDDETAGANTGVIGDFSLSVDFVPNISFTGAAGVTFPGRVMVDDGPGQSQGRSDLAPFVVTLTANYTGSELPINTTLVIDSIRIFAGNHSTGSVTNTDTLGSDLINWEETTVGNTGFSSPALDLGAANSDTSDVTNYDQLIWNPDELAVPGSTSIRSFTLETNGDLNAYLDGFEVFGHIEISTVPEPSSFLLLGLGALGMVRHARRRRRRA